MSLASILTSLLKICCGSQEPTGPQQQQQHQQYGYQGTVNQQQTAYPPQSQPSWANVVAGGQQSQFQHQQYQPQHHQQGWQSPMHQQHGGWQSPPHQNGYPAGSHGPVHLPAGGVMGPHAPASQVSPKHQFGGVGSHVCPNSI